MAMRQLDPNGVAGVFVMLVCVAVSVPVLILLANGEAQSAIPVWVWIAGFAGFMVAFIASALLSESRSRPLLATIFAVQEALAIGLVLAVSHAGWLPILLVFNAAMSAHLFGLRATGAVIAVNTLVIGAAARMGGAEPTGVALTALVYLLLQVVTALSELALTREMRARKELAAAHAELRAANALMERVSRADERLRIARELHDLIGHQLTVLALELEVAAHQTKPPAHDHVVRAGKVARELLGDVRATVGELRARTPELRETLGEIVGVLPAPKVHLSIADSVHADERTTATLVRCVQEVVTNTIRHSGARSLWIVIDADGDTLTLTARDDGCAPARIVPGNGLRGITERVEELGGSVRYWADGGLHLAAKVPAS